MKKQIEMKLLKVAFIAVTLTWSTYLQAETPTFDVALTDFITQVIQFSALPLLVIILFNKKLRLHFLWNRIVGKPFEVTDKKIRKSLQKQVNLENFRSTYAGVKVDNIYEAHAIIDFCKKEKIDVSELSGISIRIKYDENKNPEVILPKTYGLIDKICYWLLIFLMSALFLLGAAAPLLSGLFGGYLFKMKETSEYIWLSDKQYAKKIFIDPKKIKEVTLDDCEQTNISQYNMTKHEFTTMCNVLKGNKDDDKTLIKIKDKSIWLSSFLCSISAIFIYILSIELIRINKTTKLLKKTNSSKINVSNTMTAPDENMIN